MKKLLVFVLIIVCFCAISFEKQKNNPIFELENIEEVCLVSKSDLKGKDVDSVISGDKFYNFCSLNTAKRKLKEVDNNFDAIQLYFSKLEPEKIMKSLKVEKVCCTQLGNLNVICGYTPYYNDSIFLDSKKVNIQIAVCEDKLIAGFPMILTGY